MCHQVLYEPQYYGQLLDSLVALCRMGGQRTTARGWGDCPAAASAPAQVVGDSRGSADGVEEKVTDPGQRLSRGSSSGGGSGQPRALPLCFICYRRRQYKEKGFEVMALARGFLAVEEVPASQLHPDYQEGYHLIELVHDGRLTGSAASAQRNGGVGLGG
jgi:hypothetical protein